MRKLVKSGEDIKIVGVVQPVEGATATMLSSGIGYTPGLTKHVIEQAAKSKIVREQLDHPSVNVFTGDEFGADDTENKFDMASLFQIDTDALQ